MSRSPSAITALSADPATELKRPTPNAPRVPLSMSPVHAAVAVAAQPKEKVAQALVTHGPYPRGAESPT